MPFSTTGFIHLVRKCIAPKERVIYFINNVDKNNCCHGVDFVSFLLMPFSTTHYEKISKI